MDDAEKEKFQTHYNEKIQKLKNPNNSISKTRIMIKNLPKKNFDEDNLKEILEKFKECK